MPEGTHYEHVEVVAVMIHLDTEETLLLETSRSTAHLLRVLVPATMQGEDEMIDHG